MAVQQPNRYTDAVKPTLLVHEEEPSDLAGYTPIQESRTLSDLFSGITILSFLAMVNQFIDR